MMKETMWQFESGHEPGPHLPWDNVAKDLWYDWCWQLANRITTRDNLWRAFPEAAFESPWFSSCLERMRLGITPYFARLIAEQGFNGPLWRQVIPSSSELTQRPHLRLDPLGEEKDSPVDGLVHRYCDRALILLTNKCAVYCRYCNRRRRARGEERDASQTQLSRCLDYLRQHAEVREVILSGGDPLTLADAKLDDFLRRLRSTPSVEVIRISSRMPVVLPYRVNDSLCRILDKHHPVFLNVHVNHPSELTADMRLACDRLIRVGVPLGSQTVLLKGVNDDPAILKDLFSTLLTLRIRPYCLYHCDPAEGTSHFRTTIAEGKALMAYLLANLSGMAVPHYVVDAPEGAGKIPILPNYVEGTFPGGVVLRNLQGRSVRYVDEEGEIGRL